MADEAGLDACRAHREGLDGAGTGQLHRVIAGDLDEGILHFGHLLVQLCQEGGELIGQQHAGGIAQGDAGCTGGDSNADGLAQEVGFCAGRILEADFHITAQRGAVLHLVFNGGEHLRGLLAGDVLHLHAGDGRVDHQAGPAGLFKGVPGCVGFLGGQTGGLGQCGVGDHAAQRLDEDAVRLAARQHG